MSLTTTGPPPPPATPTVDPYGVDLALSADGDLIVNASGQLAAVAGAYNCAQAIFLRFKTAPGEVPLHPEYGSNLAGSIIGSKLNVAALALQANTDLQTMLTEDTRFKTATLGAIATPANENYPHDSVAVGITATLAGGESLTLQNVTDPTPSDVSQRQIVDPSVDPTLTFNEATQDEFFAADQAESGQLNDLNTIQSIVNDTPGPSILSIGG